MLCVLSGDNTRRKGRLHDAQRGIGPEKILHIERKRRKGGISVDGKNV